MKPSESRKMNKLMEEISVLTEEGGLLSARMSQLQEAANTRMEQLTELMLAVGVTDYLRPGVGSASLNPAHSVTMDKELRDQALSWVAKQPGGRGLAVRTIPPATLRSWALSYLKELDEGPATASFVDEAKANGVSITEFMKFKFRKEKASGSEEEKD